MTRAAGRPLIVVGVDGANAGMTALRWAVRTAITFDAAVEVVHAWTDSEPPTLIAREVWVAVSVVLDPPEIRKHYRRGPAAEVLVDCSRRAQLLVLGLRPGRRSPGPVILTCRRDAHCPVAVIDENSRNLDGPGHLQDLVPWPRTTDGAGMGP